MLLQSMTGYGRGTAGNFQVEIRSSNHKNLDIHINVPSYLFSCDSEIRKIVKQKVSRGRIEIYVPRQVINKIKLKVNKALAKEYYNALVSLKDELSISSNIGIDVIASHKDIFIQDEPEIEITEFFDALNIALDEVKKTRIIEAENLVNDISQRIGLLGGYINNIESRRTEFIAEARQRLHDRLKEFLSNVSIDESRLIQETAILVERSDITEEIVRIKSHLGHFEDILKSGDSVGKKIDFFIQELRREVNTIGSKSQDVEIATYVVEMKHELEKIKEQSHNLQ
ncbi:MAG: YicC family protein [Thermodesulfovibrionia bacterium]|nr:YicC family protein [Thermodesulfovibrionia bacterium]